MMSKEYYCRELIYFFSERDITHLVAGLLFNDSHIIRVNGLGLNLTGNARDSLCM